MEKRKIVAYKIKDENSKYYNKIIGLELPVNEFYKLNLHGKINENVLNPIRVIFDDETIPDGFIDVTSIENWNKIDGSLNLVNDYLIVKDEIKNNMTEKSWTGLTNNEKDLCIEYYALPNIEEPVIYLITEKGMTEQEAQNNIIENWHIHHKKLLSVCRERWYYVKLVVGLYLNFNDAEELMETVSPMIFNFIESGRFGKEFGDQRSGILDFITSKHDFEYQGLEEEGYILKSGTYEEFINKLINVLLYGIYNKLN